MKWFLVLSLLICSFANADDRSLLRQLNGKWIGKWDNKYGVKFDVSSSNGVYDIKYFVEENIGEPYSELQVQGKPLNKNSVMAGTLLFVVAWMLRMRYP